MAKRKTKRERAHQAELEKRIGEVGGLLVAGLSRAQILQYIADNADWSASTRTIDGYIRKATDRIRDAAKDARREQLDMATMRLNDLYALCMNSQDYKTPLAVVGKQIDLFGLKEAAVIARLQEQEDAA